MSETSDPGRASPAATQASSYRILATRSECQQALRQAFADAAQQGCRELWLCDADFSDWPLSERAAIDSLSQWSYSHRKLTLMAYSFDAIVRRHARWIDWRRQWSHIVECRQLDESDATQVPTLLLAPGVCTVRIYDTVHYRGSVSTEAGDATRCRELVDALWQRSSDAFASTTLGL
jgi:hypothetical protein